MKSKIAVALLTLFGLTLTSWAQEGPQSQILILSPSHTFAPPGFDDNDNAQIVIAGHFVNTCYKAAPPQIKVDSETRKITIRNRAYHFDSCWCAWTTIPYQHTIDLGVLSAGTYEIFAEESDGTIRSVQNLSIAKATIDSPDNFIYAHTESVSLEGDPKDGEATLILEGQMATRCFFMKDVQVLYRMPGVIEVLPIAQFQSDGTRCHTPITQRTKVKLNSPWKGKTLVHVRSVNGQSVNRVIEF